MPYQLRMVKETVRTKERLSRKEFIAPRVNKAARVTNSPGHITTVLGTCYFVLHEGATTPAVYLEEEVESEPNAYWKVIHTAFGLPYCKEVATHSEAEDYLESLDIVDGSRPVIEGPFYSDKSLVEGPMATLDLYDHLLDDDDL
jgi:hypothetical protein